jgi:hypothetical protein
LSLDEKDLTLDFFLESIGDGFSVFISADDFGSESFFSGEFEELIFEDVFGVVVVGEEFSFVLDVASDKGGIGVDLSDLILGVDVILLRVGVCVMVILYRSGEEEVRFLKNKLNHIRFWHNQQQVS